MTDLKKQEQLAIEAVAKRFSATWAKGGDSRGTYIRVAGKRIAVDIATLKRRGKGTGKSVKPHLRFDRVVIWLMKRLQDTLAETVPHGITVLLTVTAPILVPSKTAASLEQKMHTLLQRRSPVRDQKHIIHGNRVHLRLLKNGAERAPQMIGFVHNPDSDPLLLLNMTQELFELLTPEAARRPPKLAGDRWLLVITDRQSSCLEAYRYIYSQLRPSPKFKKTLMLFGDGRVELLTN